MQRLDNCLCLLLVHWTTIMCDYPGEHTGVHIIMDVGSSGVPEYNMVNLSNDFTPDPYHNVTIPTRVNITYMAVEIACAVASVFGNLLVIIVFCQYKRLRTITNYYVLSLAVADLLVGLIGIPAAIATSVGLPFNFQGCLFMNSFLMLLCTTSIFSLVAVSVDRFWAIMYPLNYPVVMTRTKAMLVIMFCWILAAVIGLLPSLGWNKGPPREPRCFFMEVMDLRYLAFINFATIVAPTAFMAVVYALIYRAVQRQVNMTRAALTLWCGQIIQCFHDTVITVFTVVESIKS